MVTITELPRDGSGGGEASDRQLQPQAEGQVQADGQDGAQQQAQPQPFNLFGMLKSMFFRGIVIYFVMQMFRRPTPAAVTSPDGTTQLPRGAATNLFTNGVPMDLYVYVSEKTQFSEFNDSSALIWIQKGLVYGDFESGDNKDGTYSFSTTIPTSGTFRNNGSLYMHSFIVKSGKSPDPATGKTNYSKKWTLYKMKMLNKYKKKMYHKTANLLTGQTGATELEQAKMAEGIKQEIISHWHPNITINIVNDFTNWIPGQVPPPLDEFVEFTPSLQNYKPIMYVNTYWNLNREYYPINETVTSVNLTLTFQPLSMFKWQMYSAQEMRNKFNMLGSIMGEDEDDNDQDAIKEAFLETNAYLLALTFIVSIVHSVFEFLAFKNDIQFWKNRKSLEGLSVRSVFFNVFQSLVVLLYVMDNETNTVIRIGCFVGLGIEIWKIQKVVDVSIDQESMFLGFLPKVVFKDKGNYVESGTKTYDRMAFKYLGMALYPLAFCYCVYSVIYNEHKSWYSFVLSSTYGFLLTFGFIMMTPQLFINYKLKSVAHLPWRMLTYKALNTFIDDIFAFVIKMPTMYRIGCFRDDIVFFIFLYQRYIYRVDPSRVNEFGYTGEMLDGEVKSDDETQAAITNQNGEVHKTQEDKKKD